MKDLCHFSDPIFSIDSVCPKNCDVAFEQEPLILYLNEELKDLTFEVYFHAPEEPTQREAYFNLPEVQARLSRCEEILEMIAETRKEIYRRYCKLLEASRNRIC